MKIFGVEILVVILCLIGCKFLFLLVYIFEWFVGFVLINFMVDGLQGGFDMFVYCFEDGDVGVIFVIGGDQVLGCNIGVGMVDYIVDGNFVIWLFVVVMLVFWCDFEVFEVGFFVFFEVF